MNKLITKIASLSLGLALAVGVGVALGQKEAVRAKAATYTAYTLDGTITTSADGDNSYSTTSSVTQSGLSWGVVGNTTISPWRIGGGKNIAVDDFHEVRTVASKAAVSSENISKVEVAIGTKTTNLIVESFTLKVGTAEGLEDVSSVSATFAASSTVVFNRPDGHNWTNRFFTLAVGVAQSKKTTSHNYFQLSSMAFKYDVSVIEPDAVSVSGESAVSVGSTITLTASATNGGSDVNVNQNVIWSSSNPKVASVSETGVVTGISNGNVTIYATAENVPAAVGSKLVAVSGGRSGDAAFVVVESDVAFGSYGDRYSFTGGVYMHYKQTMSYTESGAKYIQMQASTGIVENISPMPAQITSVELSIGAASNGSGYKVYASADGAEFTEIATPTKLYDNKYLYTVTSGNYYFKLEAGTGTLRLDDILVGFGNAAETKLVNLASALNDLLDSECTGSEDNVAISASKWADVEAAYNSGDADAKAALKAVAGFSYLEVNQFLERYDHIVAGYGYNNFLERAVASSGVRVCGLTNENDTIMIIVVITAAVSALAFGALLLIKKKKHN